jgi:hypothetical protein
LTTTGFWQALQYYTSLHSFVIDVSKDCIDRDKSNGRGHGDDPQVRFLIMFYLFITCIFTMLSYFYFRFVLCFAFVLFLLCYTAFLFYPGILLLTRYQMEQMLRMCVLHCYSHQWRQRTHFHISYYYWVIFFRLGTWLYVFSIIRCYCGSDCIACSILRNRQISRYYLVIFEYITGLILGGPWYYPPSSQCFGTDMVYYVYCCRDLQFLHNVIIIKIKDLISQT